MADFVTALDWVLAALLAGAFGLTVLTHRQIRGVKVAVWAAIAITVVRWGMWSFMTNDAWPIRASVGALIGALLLAGAPAIFRWIGSQPVADHPTLQQAAAAPAPIQLGPINAPAAPDPGIVAQAMKRAKPKETTDSTPDATTDAKKGASRSAREAPADQEGGPPHYKIDYVHLLSTGQPHEYRHEIRFTNVGGPGGHAPNWALQIAVTPTDLVGQERDNLIAHSRERALNGYATDRGQIEAEKGFTATLAGDTRLHSAEEWEKVLAGQGVANIAVVLVYDDPTLPRGRARLYTFFCYKTDPTAISATISKTEIVQVSRPAAAPSPPSRRDIGSRKPR